MPLFPPGVPVTVFLDGRPLPAYVQAYAAGGHVFAPVRPLLVRFADRIWFNGNVLVLQRDGRRIRIPMAKASPFGRDRAYVAVAVVLWALGARVSYQPEQRRLDVRSLQRKPIRPPQRFDPSAPSVAPRPVFTPEAVATPRPRWTGSPLPRRTPLPAPPTTRWCRALMGRAGGPAG